MTSEPTPRPPLDRERLAALVPEYAVEVLATSPSTNAVVAERARAGGPEGLVVVAEHQTAGRGRLDRSWVTPDRAALTFSVLLRPGVPPGRWPWLPLLAGLALTEVGVPGLELKWPNDVLVDDLKVAGLLVELVDTPDGPAAVLGLGLNVSTTVEELAVPTATSLAIAGIDVDRTELLARYLRRLAERVAAWRTDAGQAELRAAYTAACGTVGRDVRVDLPGGEALTGTAEGVDADGRLVVGGRAVAAGDVVHVRPQRPDR